jgi:hypothetical protein
MNNFKQVQLAIIMYASDNGEKYPENPGSTIPPNSWITGKLRAFGRQRIFARQPQLETGRRDCHN